jgi:hypothetical protein
MTDLIDDHVFSAFAVSGPPETIGPQILERYSDLVDRITFYTPEPLNLEDRSQLVADIRATSPETSLTASRT